MSSGEDLLKAVRSGNLARVREVLDAGVPVELNDGKSDPGMPLGMACFMGHAAIVRELLQRGARANLPDNHAPVSPLSMALRGDHTDVVRLLIEWGALVPPDMPTKLSDQEIMAAEWQAFRSGKRAAPPSGAEGEVHEVEEIVMPKAFGIDTTVLNADAILAAMEKERLKKAAK